MHTVSPLLRKRSSLMSVATEIFQEFPILETDRVLLRELRPSDAGSILSMRQDERMNSFVPREPIKTLEDAETVIRKSRQAFFEGTGITWGGILKEGEDKVVGMCWFNRVDKSNDRAELGGELSTDLWGKHLPFEVIRRILCFGFKELGLHSIEARVCPGNRGTISLLERVGFEKEGHLREAIRRGDKFYDQNIYSLRNGEPNGWDFGK